MLTPEAKTDCVNLREMFGKRWRISWDPAYEPRYVAKEDHDPWMMQIPCKWGITIYPHGGESLAVEVDGHNRIAKKLGAIPGVVLHQDGDDEKTFLFPITVFDPVAAIVDPKRVKQMTDEQKAKLIEAGQVYQFKAGAKKGFPERQAPEKPKGGQEVA